MRYDKFDEYVEYYRKRLTKGSLLIEFDVHDEDAFFSIAPLTCAAHENGCDISVIGVDGNSAMLSAMHNSWLAYENLKNGRKDASCTALDEFIRSVNIKGFERLFEKPDIMLKSSGHGFIGTFNLEYRSDWFRPYKWNELIDTAKRIFLEVYNLKKGERTSIGFETIPKKAELDNPLQDYLDNFAIARVMMLVAKEHGPVSMGADSPRWSQLEPMNPMTDLRVTLLGCELSKEIDEEVFRKFRKLSGLIGIDKIKINDASFFISGKGYPGKHLFGDTIGYPDPKKKTRWQSPGQFIYKLDYYPQTDIDERMPLSRVGFTSTLPIDVFINANNVDWREIKRKNDVLRKIADRSEKIYVLSEKSSFEVGLIKEGGQRRRTKGSDTSIRSKINKEYLKKTGKYAGNMANLPGGEMFLTPEYVKGKIIGDVIINVDQSYKLSEENPLIIESDFKGYRITGGPKEIIKKLDKRKKESWQMLDTYEKNKSMPKDLIELKRKNFEKIGEFAINTNPKARLCDYLIVNEKIAGMIHVALGSGFDSDRTTEYHMDIVINAKKQNLDIFGTSNGKKLWMMKKGKLCV